VPALRAPRALAGGRFPTPFEICWYRQAEIIPSGSKWSTYDCERCRPVVRAWNDRLDEAGLVSFPVGRHSLQHRWRHVRPFTTAPMMAEWKRERPREGWSESGLVDPEWLGLAAVMRARRWTWGRWTWGRWPGGPSRRPATR
jgi:hypothetical protein